METTTTATPAEELPWTPVKHKPVDLATSPLNDQDFALHGLALAHLENQENSASLYNRRAPRPPRRGSQKKGGKKKKKNGSTPTRNDPLHIVRVSLQESNACNDALAVLDNGVEPTTTLPQQESYEDMRAQLLNLDEKVDEDRLAMILFNGAHFIKHGKRGKPKPKFVVCSQDGMLFWSDITGGKTLTSVKLIGVSKVHTGKHTSVFERRVAEHVPDNLCLSIVTKERTLDLQAETEKQRNMWVKALRFAVENVQLLGRVARQPVTTSELERKELEYDRTISQLQNQIKRTTRTIAAKNDEIKLREQQLVMQRRDSQTALHVKDQELAAKEAELRQHQDAHTALNQRLKKIHHERQASRQVHTSAYRELEQRLAKEREEKAKLQAAHAEEQRNMRKIIQDSKTLLAKAKETIHRRQQSRAEKLASLAALEQEASELRKRNLELRAQLASAQALEERAQQDIQKAKKLMALAKAQDVDLDDLVLPTVTLQQPAASSQDTTAEHKKSVEEEEEEDAPASAPADTTAGGQAPPLEDIAENSCSDDNAEDNGNDMRTVVMPPSTPVTSAARSRTASISLSAVKTPRTWQPDNSANHCGVCSDSFGIFTRRHHCRKCGGLICDDCSQGRAIVEQTGKAVRVCDPCMDC